MVNEWVKICFETARIQEEIFQKQKNDIPQLNHGMRNM